MTDPQSLLTVGDVAALAGVSKECVVYWVRTRKLRVAQRAGGRRLRLFRRRDVETWLARWRDEGRGPYRKRCAS